jgi:hypothetical protein
VTLVTAAAGLALLAWLYLLLFHHRFWLADQRLRPAGLPAEESVVAVVPARDEADVVGGAVGSLLDQAARPPLRPDRRLRARAAPEAPGPDLARPHPRQRQPASL